MITHTICSYWIPSQTRTRTPAFWGYPLPPHDYPLYWVILDPKSKEDKVKNLKNLPKLRVDTILSTDRQTDRLTDGRTDWTIHRAAWSQLKICRESRHFQFICWCWREWDVTSGTLAMAAIVRLFVDSQRLIARSQNRTKCVKYVWLSYPTCSVCETTSAHLLLPMLISEVRCHAQLHKIFWPMWFLSTI